MYWNVCTWFTCFVFVTGIGRFTVEEQETVEHFTKICVQGLKRHMIVLYIV